MIGDPTYDRYRNVWKWTLASFHGPFAVLFHILLSPATFGARARREHLVTHGQAGLDDANQYAAHPDWSPARLRSIHGRGFIVADSQRREVSRDREPRATQAKVLSDRGFL